MTPEGQDEQRLNAQQKANERRLAMMRRAEAWMRKQYGEYAPESDYDYSVMIRAMVRFADQERRRKGER